MAIELQQGVVRALVRGGMAEGAAEDLARSLHRVIEHEVRDCARELRHGRADDTLEINRRQREWLEQMHHTMERTAVEIAGMRAEFSARLDGLDGTLRRLTTEVEAMQPTVTWTTFAPVVLGLLLFGTVFLGFEISRQIGTLAGDIEANRTLFATMQHDLRTDLGAQIRQSRTGLGAQTQQLHDDLAGRIAAPQAQIKPPPEPR